MTHSSRTADRDRTLDLLRRGYEFTHSLRRTLRRLSRLDTTMPSQDLTVSLRRMPTRPASGVRLALATTGVRSSG